jgi:O-antigen ligase
MNPGPLGGYLAFAFIVAVCLCSRRQKERIVFWWLSVAVLLMGYVCVFRSDSRAAWLSVAVVLGWLAMRSTIHRPTLQITRNQFCHCKLYISVCMGVLVLLSAVLLYGYRRDSALARMFIWKVSTTMIAESPLFGNGTGSYPSRYMLAQGNYFEHHPNSSYGVSADNNFCGIQ